MTEPNLTTLLNGAKDKRKKERRIDNYGDPEIGRRIAQRRQDTDRHYTQKEHYTQMARIAALENCLRGIADTLERTPSMALTIRKLLADDQK